MTTVGFQGKTLGTESISSVCITTYHSEEMFYAMPCSGLSHKFPYGLGGIGNKRGKSQLSDAQWKKHLLMYHDKRFQTDPYFPLVAFNHEQIKQATDGGFVLTKQSKFDSVTILPQHVDNMSGLIPEVGTRQGYYYAA